MSVQNHGAEDFEAENRLLRYMELAGDWVFELDGQEIVTFCHKGATATDSESPGRYLGRHFSIFVTARDHDTVLERLRACRNRENAHGRIRYIDSAGCPVELEVASRYEGDAFAGYFVVARNRSEDPMEAKSSGAEASKNPTGDLLEGIVKNYPGIIWCVDTGYTMTLCEGMALSLADVRPGEFTGRQLSIMDGPLKPFYAGTVKTFEEGPQSFTLEIAGRHMHCMTNLLRDGNGNVTGQVGIAQDVSELWAIQFKLEQAIGEAEQASSAKSEFLSRMSHEIRTPMNAIIGMNSIARKSDDIEKIRYCLEKIEAASKQLLGLINDILDMSKIEANKFEISDNEFDFEIMLQNVCNVINVKIEEKHQLFNIDFDDVFLSYLVCDELRLSQVMINLLTNAVKFTPERGSITLKIRHFPVDDEVSKLHVEVQDTGIGVSDEQKQRLFNSFEQADGGTTRKYGGTGLGLAICKRIVNLMGGDIWVESEVGAGSRFIFEVNVRWGGDLMRETLETTGVDTRRIRILTVDDSEDVRIYFSNILDNFSLRNDVAEDGLEALEMVRDAIDEGDPYNLIFMDWQMPGIDGIETSRRIKKIVRDSAIIIMISVADWSDIEEQAVQSGISRFLPKPVLPSMLFNTIRETMEYSIFAESEEMPVQPGAEGGFQWRSKHILLAEDIEINKEIILSILEETGVSVDWAQNGRIAAELFAENPEKYHLILMDIQMPELDGLQATKVIRGGSSPHAKAIPIIAMTANAFKEDVEQCINAGMNDHIAKPISLEDLMGKLDAVLR